MTICHQQVIDSPCQVFALRSPEDANSIAAAAGKDKHVVVLGTSFIGMEVGNGVFSRLSPRDPVNFPAPQAGLTGRADRPEGGIKPA